MGLYKREIILAMSSKRNVVNGLAVLTILICGAGLAGSLIEQIDGSREPPEESEPQTSFPAESQPVNQTGTENVDQIRFTIGEFAQRKNIYAKTFSTFFI